MAEGRPANRPERRRTNTVMVLTARAAANARIRLARRHRAEYLQLLDEEMALALYEEDVHAEV